MQEGENKSEQTIEIQTLRWRIRDITPRDFTSICINMQSILNFE